MPAQHRLGPALVIAAVAATVAALSPPMAAAEPSFVVAPSIARNPNPTVPLAAVLSFTASGPVATTIAVTDGKNSWTLRYGAERDPSKGLPVVGMRPDREHRVSVTITDAAGATATHAQALSVRTPPLPNDPNLWPKIEAVVHDRTAMEGGVTILNPRRQLPLKTMKGASTENTFNQTYGTIVAVDADGEVVWYYQGPARISDFQTLANDNLLFMTTAYELMEIDLLGNVVRTWYAKNRPQGAGKGIPVDALTFHHSVQEMPNGDLLVLSTDRRLIENYYTSEYDADAPRKAQWVMGDEIVQFRRADGAVVWRWNAFDHLDPMQIGYDTFAGYWNIRGFPGTLDWTHANGVRYQAADDSVLLNVRHLSAILKIDRKSGQIVWIVGEPSRWRGPLRERLMRLTAGEWFWTQHSPTLTAEGTLLMFNNDNFRAHPFHPPQPPAAVHSHVTEYAVDQAARTVRPIWTSRFPGEPQYASRAMGSAQYLTETGNVLAGYGMILVKDGLDTLTWEHKDRHPVWTQVREYRRSNPARPVWDVAVKPLTADSKVGWALYGGIRSRWFLRP